MSERKLALRIEVGTLRGARVDAPSLAGLLNRHGAKGTFLFAFGPDRSGRAVASLPGAPRLRCYGMRTLLAGTLLPARDIDRQCAGEMRSIRAAGHEAGILAYDRALWMRRVHRGDEAWTRASMQRACERFEEVFGTAALTHGAPGWRMNPHAWRYTQRLGFRHASDCRGTGPFIPVVNAEPVACPQLPTTLPTLDELLAAGLTPDTATRRLLELSEESAAGGHVYSLHAEIEGGPYSSCLDALLEGWRALGYRMLSLEEYCAELSVIDLPRRTIVDQPHPRDGTRVSAEGEEFLAATAGGSACVPGGNRST